METVAGEKPLCVATSRMVTAVLLPPGRFTAVASCAVTIILLDSPTLQRLPIVLRHRFVCATLFGGQFKRQWLAESSRLPEAEGNPGKHPDRPPHHRQPAQADPQPQAKDGTHQRRQKKPHLLFFRTHQIEQKS